MKILFSIFIFILMFCSPVFGQQNSSDVIYLKNGEKYIGKIILNNEQIVMLETEGGKKYQFQTSEIKEIRQEEVTPENNGQIYNIEGNLTGFLQINGGVSAIKGAITNTPSMDLSLAFGNKKAFGKNLFLGAGAGFYNIFDVKNKHNISFLPVFIQTKNIFSEKSISPALNLKLGYAIPLQKSYSGGLFLHTSSGINIKTSEKSDIYFGLYIQLQPTYGQITETLPQGIYISNSNAVITNFGISSGFTF